jgi:hypothetical protein
MKIYYVTFGYGKAAQVAAQTKKETFPLYK